MNIVGICGGKYGQSEVGKTVSAEFIKEAFGFHVLSLKNPIIEVCRSSGNELTPENLDHVCRKGRAISEDYWLNLSMKSVPPGTTGLVLDDLWFGNEAKFVRGQKGLVLCVKRPEVLDDSHREFVPCSEITNDLTKNDLRASVLGIVARYFGLVVPRKV